ncbi:TonB-dependent receptor [Puteibacter caeruleilacunae]|nr:TonB-dependent receptor [Puteibacter caeruleilacunae]
MNKVKYRLIVLFIVVLTYVNVNAQESLLQKSIKIDCKDCTLEEILTRISDQTNIKFAYSESQVNVKQIIKNIKLRNTKDLVQELQKNYNIDYKLIGQTVSLFPRKNNQPTKSVTISGFLEDVTTGERLIGANIYSPKTYEGTSTNNYGFFSIPISAEINQLTFSYIGYQTKILPVSVSNDTLIRIGLKPSLELDEIKVFNSKNEIADKRQSIGILKIPVNKIKEMPVMLGEADVLKTAQLLPGISEGSEGNSGLYVRGGSPDQNLILLDGIPVYNPNHLFGFYSVFNTDAIKNMQVIKGGFPARYGGRLSSVVDLRMKEGNTKKLSGGASIGLISSKFNLEGPIIKDQTSFFISARRTYIDLFTNSLFDNATDFDQSNYYFYDINAKINHKFSNKHRLYFSYYTGRDNGNSEDKNEGGGSKLETEEVSKLSWGNSIYGLRWNWLMSSNLFLNTTVAYSTYEYLNDEIFKNKYQINNENISKEYSSKVKSGINIFSTGLNFNWNPSLKHNIRFGGKYYIEEFNTGMSSKKFLSEKDKTESVNEAEIINGEEVNLFIEDNYQISNKLSTNMGVHYSLFKVGSKTYTSLEPRLSLKYNLNDKIQLNAGAAIMQQYTQLLSFSRITLSSDIWVPVTENIKPAKSKQASLGGHWSINDSWSLSMEGYYKKMSNLLEYSESASLFKDNSWQERVEQGSGNSYGLEFLIQRTKGRLTGWIAYTLAESTRKFEKINYGKEFPYKYDKRHDLNIVLDYKLNKHWSVNGVWTYRTGNAETLGTLKYRTLLGFNGHSATSSSDIIVQKRNAHRMPAYHRLDLSLNWKAQKGKFEHAFSLGLYNVYNQKNPYKISLYDESVGEQGVYFDKKVIKEKSLFGILPAISYSIKF